MQPVNDFLLCKTPDAWVEAALGNLNLLLIDHANCEKKAASTALNLMYRYIDNFDLLNKMSRLAREELRHFEQVIAIMKQRGIAYEPLNASRYAAKMRETASTFEPDRLIDTLIIGAIIEARSCERFARIAPHLDEDLKKFYFSLLKSEARHFQDYLQLAGKVDPARDISQRITHFLEVDRSLILSADHEFRFHSGLPSQEMRAS